jgi:hypothetical protein
VGDDSDVSDVCERRSTGHGNFRLNSGGWASLSPPKAAISSREW